MTDLYWLGDEQKKDHVDVLIVDGYVDEPSLLGVPPYISPVPRMLAGIAQESGLSWEYVTADEYRQSGLPLGDMLLLYGGVTVPGKYLSGTPLSVGEAQKIAEEPGETFLGGPLARFEDIDGFDHVSEKDLPAYFFDSLYREGKDRWSTLKERDRWLRAGVEVVERHPMHPDPLIAEISTYRGCPRYITGGCSFCSEPLYGRPEFREQEDIVDEIGALYETGMRNFRLGGQSCIVSYKAEGVGEREVPVPRPGELRSLFRGIHQRCPNIEVLHVDNANPKVIADHPDKSGKILEVIKRYTTPGNVLAFGMESADPEVIEKNNLNAGPEEVKRAVEITNEIGRERGENGMPKLLPGLNFLGGLKGESEDTYRLNFEFLKELVREGLWLRRINIRQVLSTDEDLMVKNKGDFISFKERVREEIDHELLKNMFPVGTLIKDVLMEKHDGRHTFGRQVGTYPLLIGIEYELELGRYHDIKVTDHGFRSVTGIHHPFRLDSVSFNELQALPGVGKKRAAKIFRESPGDEDELRGLIEDQGVLTRVLELTCFEEDISG